MWYLGKGLAINQGFFIAQRQADGSPGKPIGDEETGAIMMFEELDSALEVKSRLQAEHGQLSIFKINLVFAGEVVL